MTPQGVIEQEDRELGMTPPANDVQELLLARGIDVIYNPKMIQKLQPRSRSANAGNCPTPSQQTPR
jgi:hypothetical protein